MKIKVNVVRFSQTPLCTRLFQRHTLTTIRTPRICQQTQDMVARWWMG